MNDDKNSAGSGSYVLNAMDENEREEFEAQMAGSEELRNEVTELTDTAVLLGLAVAPITPPPALKQNIMARLSQTPQLPREAAPDAFAPVRTLHAVPAMAIEEDAAPAAMTPAATKAQARWYARPVFAVAAVAAAVALVAGGIGTANLATQNNTNSQEASALAAINTASDVQQASATVATGGTATLVWSDKLGKSVFIGKNLKALPGSKTYELWYISSATGKATPAGLFQADGTSTPHALTGKMVRGDTVGVTIEPSGGSKTPTTTPIVAIKSV